MRILACLVLPSCVLGACAAPAIPVVPPAVGCPVPPTLAQACAAPRSLSGTLSFGDLLLEYRTDRASLESCAASQRDLVRLLANCQAILADYNERLGDRSRARP